METITFYSYKGGVGRTLSLANIAVYLSRFGLNVCIVDFDLEAPGIHYKLQSIFPGPVERGLVDYIYEFTSGGSIPGSLNDYVLTAENIPEGEGNIQLIPAGNVLSSEYWKKLASIDWHSLFYEIGGEGVPFFLEFKEKIRSELQPDILLIDSRTGITEMSGICTALLPDKVVFLITNNRENIEGSRQIMRGIQKAKRFKGQKPIEVFFALTRIPNPQNAEENENEQKIIASILSFLNESTANLEDQLNIPEIFVLHSDRDLELSESLRLNQYEFRDKPLTQDYLKLFLKIIPREITESKINSVVERVITEDRLLEEPDKVQEELEALAASYPSPQTYEKLIDFYILRNMDKSKILAVYSSLFKVTRTLSEKMYAKFIQAFKKASIYWIEKDILEKVEEYLQSNPGEKKDIALKLADAYYDKRLYERALEWYLNLLDKVKDPSEILEKIFAIYRQDKIGNGRDVLKVYVTYNSLILEKTSLKIKALEALYEKGEIEQVKKLIDRIDITEDSFIEHSSGLFYEIIKSYGSENTVNEKLSAWLKIALKRRDSERVYKLGRIFFELGKAEEFRKAIPEGFPIREKILNDLERKFR
ncbi:MAG: AAA family ATPase [Candidatus Aminicenantes bacterium]|nr:AAA family ATPase [Candidatus Aminicenantes bacterium]